MFLLIAGTNISGKSLKGSCGNSDDNPCTCSFLERTNCKNKVIQQSTKNKNVQTVQRIRF